MPEASLRTARTARSLRGQLADMKSHMLQECAELRSHLRTAEATFAKQGDAERASKPCETCKADANVESPGTQTGTFTPVVASVDDNAGAMLGVQREELHTPLARARAQECKRLACDTARELLHICDSAAPGTFGPDEQRRLELARAQLLESDNCISHGDGGDEQRSLGRMSLTEPEEELAPPSTKNAHDQQSGHVELRDELGDKLDKQLSMSILPTSPGDKLNKQRSIPMWQDKQAPISIQPTVSGDSVSNMASSSMWEEESMLPTRTNFRVEGSDKAGKQLSMSFMPTSSMVWQEESMMSTMTNFRANAIESIRETDGTETEAQSELASTVEELNKECSRLSLHLAEESKNEEQKLRDERNQLLTQLASARKLEEEQERTNDQLRNTIAYLQRLLAASGVGPEAIEGVLRDHEQMIVGTWADSERRTRELKLENNRLRDKIAGLEAMKNTPCSGSGTATTQEAATWAKEVASLRGECHDLGERLHAARLLELEARRKADAVPELETWISQLQTRLAQSERTNAEMKEALGGPSWSSIFNSLMCTTTNRPTGPPPLMRATNDDAMRSTKGDLALAQTCD